MRSGTEGEATMDCGVRLFLAICLVVVAVLGLEIVPIPDNRIIGVLLVGGLLCEYVGGIIQFVGRNRNRPSLASGFCLLGLLISCVSILFMQRAGWSWPWLAAGGLLMVVWLFPASVRSRRLYPARTRLPQSPANLD